MAAAQSAQREPAAAQRTVIGHRLEGVGRTGRVVTAHLAVQRTDCEPPCLQETDHEVLHHCVTRLRLRARSAPRASYDASAAAGRARTTSAARPGSSSSNGRCSRVRCRSRRFTRLRTTALPTALLTVKPTSTGRAEESRSTRRWTTTVGVPARRPDRTAPRKASLSARRWTEGSTAVCRELRLSDCQALAALTATAGQDRTAGAGPHAKAETVHLVTATVVRLVGTLAHGYISECFEGCPLHYEGGVWRFGRHRPPTRPPGGGSWTCGTRRHGATGQRYAVAEVGVKPSTSLHHLACG